MGLAIGSFLNVCIYRIPLGQSIVFPASRCTRAAGRWPGTTISGRELALLGGRCGFCGEPVSARYPAIEALTAASSR